MTISMDKKYRTRCGHKAEICATDGDGDYPVQGKVYNGYEWQDTRRTKDGHTNIGKWTFNDLIEIDPEINKRPLHMQPAF